VRTKEQSIQTAVVTDNAFKHAAKLSDIFRHRAYATSYPGWAGLIDAQIAECRTFKLMGLAICGLLSQNQEAELPEFQKILASMKNARKALKDSIRIHKSLLKVKLPPT